MKRYPLQMITLYGIPGTATTAPHIVLEEIGVDYEFVLVERDDDGVPTAPARYLDLSPFGKVPALKHGDLMLTEAAACCLHLADSFPEAGLIPPVGSAERATTMRWLMLLTNTVQAAYLRYFYTGRHTTDPAGVPGVKAAAVRDLTELRDYIGGLLQPGPFLLGDRFTIADVYLMMLTSWSTDMDPAAYWLTDPAIKRHYAAVLARPAALRAMQDEGGTVTTD